MENSSLIFSIIIPAYNGEPFIDNAIHSLVSQRINEQNLHVFYEIIIINDGSNDSTASISENIAKKWNPKTRSDFIRVINKENGQYGSVINRGLKEARGQYFKILDCDDSFNTSSFIKLIYIVMGLKNKVDVIFTDHIFDKVNKDKKILESLRKWFIPYKVLDLNKQKFPHNMITMHSIIYRTDFLRKIKYKQLEGVYYSDSIYSIVPLASAKTLYYVSLPLYRYYIGRSEQSINLKVMSKNRSNQRDVLDFLLNALDIKKIKSDFISIYALFIMRTLIQWQILLIFYDKSAKHKKRETMELLKYVKFKQPHFYKNILKGPFILIVKITRGNFLRIILKYGIKLYAIFKKDIMAEWD